MNSADIPKTGIPGPGTVLGQYRLEKLIAQGGMGWVFSAHDLTLDRLVAVKVLAPQLMADADAVRSFRQEARAAANLAHINVVRIYAAGEQDGLAFFVTEFVGGTDLATVLREHGHLEPRETMQLVRQAAMGLQHAHWNGIIHGDVKPANLLLDESGCVKVTDFGLARWLGSAPATDGQPHLFCSPDYVSPETVAGRPADQRSDIYSLGATLYHLLTGAPPFAGDADSMLLQHLHDVPAPAASRRPGISAALNDLVSATLAKDPADRPQDYQEFIAALDLCLESPPPPRKVIVSPTRSAADVLRKARSTAARPERSNGWIWGVLAAVVIIVVIGFAVRRARSAREAGRRAQLLAAAQAQNNPPKAVEAPDLETEAAGALETLKAKASAMLAARRWGDAAETIAQWDNARYAKMATWALWDAERRKILDAARQSWDAVRAKALSLRQEGRHAEALALYDDFAADCHGMDAILKLVSAERSAAQEAQQKAAMEREAKLRDVEHAFHSQVVGLQWDDARQAVKRASDAEATDPALGTALAAFGKEAEGLIALRDAAMKKLNASPGPEVSLSTTRGIVKGCVVVANRQFITLRQTLDSSAVVETQLSWTSIGPVGVARLYATFMDPTNVVQRRGYASLLVHLAEDRLVSADAARKEVQALVDQAPEEADIFTRYLSTLPAGNANNAKPAAIPQTMAEARVFQPNHRYFNVSQASKNAMTLSGGTSGSSV